jgi:molybdate transport system substrate-binding protein
MKTKFVTRLMRGLSMLSLAIVAAVAMPGAGARAAALKVMSAGAVSDALKNLAADYTKASGVRVDLVFGNVGMIQERLKAGEAADIVILSTAAIEALDKTGGIASGGGVALGRIGMGVAAKAGAPRPDIATPASFKATLLAAKTIAYSDPAGGGSSGIYFDGLIQKLGIADAVRSKAVLIRGGSAADRVANGEAELAVQNMSELMHVTGVQLVGPFPAAYQNYLAYAAGVSAYSAEPKQALAFIRYLTRSEATARWQEAGVEPAAAK